MKLSSDGRLFVACSNDNTVYGIDHAYAQVIERFSTTLTPLAPEGSTPNALGSTMTRKLLYIANADNNSIAVAAHRKPRTQHRRRLHTHGLVSICPVFDGPGTHALHRHREGRGRPPGSGPEPLASNSGRRER